MFNQVVAFLSPFLTHTNARQALLLSAFNISSTLLNQINYEGPPSSFVPRLVRVLQHYGETSPNTQALWQLLLTIREQVSASRYQEIDAFQAWANTAHHVTLEPGDRGTGSAVTNNSVTIGGNVTGGIIGVGSHQTFHGSVTITTDRENERPTDTAAPSAADILQALINELKAALQSVPAPHNEAALLSTRLEALIHEMSQNDLDAEAVAHKARRLREAAGQARAGLPHVATLGERISAQVLAMTAP